MFLKNLFKKLFKPKGIKIIRVANEGFNSKPYDQGSKRVFLDVVINDLNETIIPSQKQVLHYENEQMEGCFCFLEGFDETQFDGNLPFRKGHKWNIGYLPKDELVFVRNTRNNRQSDKFVTEYYTGQIDIFTGGPSKGRLIAIPYEFVKMPLSLAMERMKNPIATKEDGLADEEISEIYVTKKQIEEILKIKK